MGQRTPLFDEHSRLSAKVVDFGGWDMPIHYGSQLEEHHAVRCDAGVFDVSHMTVVELHGVNVEAYLDRLLANDFKRLNRAGQAMYSGMLNKDGGVIDDLIVYRTGNPCLVVVNCATREKDLAWMNQQAGAFDVDVRERNDVAILAVQGPAAIEKVSGLVSDAQRQCIAELKAFQGAWSDGWFIARTGYTGERGLEVILPAEAAVPFWQALLAAGVKPIGLGARDTLRLEAGMNLYGADMDETIRPDQCGLHWVIDTNKEFIGKESLLNNQAAAKIDRLGIVLDEPGVLRAGVEVFDDDKPLGVVTSGGFSPSLKKSIGFARVDLSISNSCQVSIRGKKLNASLCKLPFYKKGQGQIILRGES